MQRSHFCLALLGAAGLRAQTLRGPADLNRVVAGSAAPDFDLPAVGGNRVSLRSLRGKNVVLVFYRGYW